MSQNNSCIDDSDTIQLDQVENVVRRLSVSYSQLRLNFLKEKSRIDFLLAKNEVTEAVAVLKRIFDLPQHLVKQVGYSAKIEGSAAVYTVSCDSDPRPIKAILFFCSSKAALAYVPDYLVLHMIAHELSHVRLDLDQHMHCDSEFATDVLAILIAGNYKDFSSCMYASGHKLGYIRKELCEELFTQLRRYVPVMYL